MNKIFRWRFLLLIVIAIGVIVIIKLYPRLTQKTLLVDLAINVELLNDGPYLFTDGDSVMVEWVGNGALKSTTVHNSAAIHISPQPDYKFKVNDLKALLLKSNTDFKGVEKIAVLSDIHGQYDLYIQLMKANKVIDNELNWNYGDGHLVIIGDAFDRGDKVNETLWHIVMLAKQAVNQGGKVHYLLGNHDVMVLNGDLRYIHEDYQTTERLLKKSYDELYGKKSWMGQWLRLQPVVIRINDILFNHAGLSTSIMHAGLGIDDINATFSKSILDNHRDSIRANPELSLLARSKGPIWYRGYFRDTTLSVLQVDSVLNHFDARHIVVGHTSMQKVESYFNNKVIAADTSIKRGENGEILFIENGKWYRAGLNGERKVLW